MTLGGYDQGLMGQGDHSSFGLSWAMISISPEFDVICEVFPYFRVNILEQDSLLASIAIEPLVA